MTLETFEGWRWEDATSCISLFSFWHVCQLNTDDNVQQLLPFDFEGMIIYFSGFVHFDLSKKLLTCPMAGLQSRY